MRTSVIGLAIVFNLQLAFAQDFQKSHALVAGGHISVWNYTGTVRVSGYKGNSVEIVAYKKGPDRDLIEIVDSSFGNRIEVFPRYLRLGHGNASVDFDVRVPESVAYNFSRLSSFGGNVEVSNITGRLRAESVRGDVSVKDIQGMVSASSVSGNVNVDIGQLLERTSMRFSAISGNIIVRAPSNLDAKIHMSSANGLLKTDFPIEIQEMRYGPGRTAHGILGSGRYTLDISSVSGQVSLIKK